MFSDWVNKATLDQSKCFIRSDMPWAISISLDTVLRNLGKFSEFERWGDELDWEIYCYNNISNLLQFKTFAYIKHTCTRFQWWDISAIGSEDTEQSDPINIILCADSFVIRSKKPVILAEASHYKQERNIMKFSSAIGFSP